MIRISIFFVAAKSDESRHFSPGLNCSRFTFKTVQKYTYLFFLKRIKFFLKMYRLRCNLPCQRHVKLQNRKPSRVLGVASSDWKPGRVPNRGVGYQTVLLLPGCQADILFAERTNVTTLCAKLYDFVSKCRFRIAGTVQVDRTILTVHDLFGGRHIQDQIT